jgi:Spy/CpxP family protein refolding chaperone
MGTSKKEQWMRALRLLFMAALVLGVWPAAAQTAIEENVALLRAVQQKDAKTLIGENLKLTEAQARAFWPVYNRYEAQRAKIDVRMDTVLQDYKLSCLQLCDEKAGQLLNEWMSARHDLDELRQSYVVQFGAVIPPTKVMRLYQLEGLREAVVRLDRFKTVPLAK